MKKHFASICCAVLAVSAALAREPKVPLPLKPADDGPSLEITMKFIREKLEAKQTEVTVIEISAEPTTCQFTETFGVPSVETVSFPFREVEKIEVMSIREAFRVSGSDSEPRYPNDFEISLHMTRQRSVHLELKHMKKGKSVVDEDRYQGEWSFTVADEDSANRIAKAMLHAVELCGGGSKPEPF
jgi:hypothetical protein